MDERDPAQSCTSHGDPPAWRVCAMAYTPWALPVPRPLTRGMKPDDRCSARRANQAFIHRHLGTYLDRGGRVMVAMCAVYLAGLWLLQSRWVAVLGGIGMLLNLLHLACLAFWKQQLDDRFGPHP